MSDSEPQAPVIAAARDSSREQRTPAAQSTGATARDTARGIVAVVGAVPVTRVVLRAGERRSVTLTGSLADEIGVASGADVWVSGRLDDGTIEVSRYSVRTVDGVPAVSGTLAADGARLILVADDGRRLVVAHPPAALSKLVGARLWMSGELSGTINAYGVLRAKR